MYLTKFHDNTILNANCTCLLVNYFEGYALKTSVCTAKNDIFRLCNPCKPWEIKQFVFHSCSSPTALLAHYLDIVSFNWQYTEIMSVFIPKSRGVKFISCCGPHVAHLVFKLTEIGRTSEILLSVIVKIFPTVKLHWHLSQYKTISYLQREFWWLFLAWDAQEYITACQSVPRTRPQPLLMPVSSILYPYQGKNGLALLFNFITGLLASERKTLFLPLLLSFLKQSTL